MIKLPFILISTKDCPENEIELTKSQDGRNLNIAMKKPLNFYGDIDALMKLKFFRADKEWLNK